MLGFLWSGFGWLRSFWEVTREFNPQTFVEERERTVRLVLVGPAGVGKRALAHALLGGDDPELLHRAIEWIRIVEGLDHDVGVDAHPTRDRRESQLVVYVVADDPEALHAVRSRLEAHGGGRVVVVVNRVDQVGDRHAFDQRLAAARQAYPEVKWVVGQVSDPPSAVAELAPALLDALPDRWLALGYRFPGLRPAVARALTRQTSRANAKFALVSSLPANIPIVGGLFAASADFLVLTKNQIMLVLKLAALTGRSLDSPPRLLMEIAPVVGSAFLWRTIARELLALVPGVVGAVPKTALAYVGTEVVGRVAATYYLSGARPQPNTIQRFTREAWQSFRSWRHR